MATSAVSNSTTTANTAASSTAAAATNPNGTMGQNEFLKLLIAQLKNQNPLSPMDSTQFTAQMAQFSSLEQLTNINKSLGSLSQVTSAVNNSEAMGMIGKTVEATGNTIDITNGAASTLNFNLAGVTNKTDIAVTDSTGKVVATMSAGAMSAGNHVFGWDGKDASGNVLPNGTYTYSISAQDQSGTIVNATTYMTGKVGSVSIQNGTTYLNVGNKQINMTDVMQVSQ